MRFSPDFLDELRARLPVSEVVGARVKLKKAGREWKGLSPFNEEKTPSFFVNDVKAYWFDFSCGRNGDIFDFVMATEGCEFPEAVERLARLAGLALPQMSAEEEARGKRRAVMRDMHASAAAFFEAQLHGLAEAVAARAYLSDRGIDPETCRRFRIGWAPWSGEAIKRHLISEGADLEDASESGLVLVREEGGLRDRFVGRIMFPICDAQGRTIAFAGRALEEGQQPKYLNSPETPTFVKGSTVYNVQAARKAAHAGEPVYVVEGYMDVVAMDAAGRRATVCTMGTAITAEQLAVIWRFAEEPAITLDGDDAGQRAAARIAEAALPHIGPGRSLKFIRMPQGLDPDTLLREQGGEALSAVLEHTEPLSAALWRAETEGREIDTPEKRAALEARLRDLLRMIRDASVRRHYGEQYKANLVRLYAGKPIETVAKPSRYGRVSWSEMDAPRAREYEWLIKGLIPANETACVTGPSGSGKTYQVFDMCMHIALGRTYRGRRVQQGLVVYAAPEGGTGLVDRMRAYRAFHELPLEGVPFDILTRRFNIFANEADVVGLIDEIITIRAEWEARGTNLRLVVIDTFSAATSGIKENAGEDVGVVRTRMKRIEEACGCGILFVHHLNAAGERARGHGSIIADIDTELRVERVLDNKDIQIKDDDDRDLRRTTVKKQREGKDGDFWDFVLKWIPVRKDEDGEDVGQCVAIEPARANTGQQESPRGRRRVDGTNLTKTEALFFRALLDAVDEYGMATPPSLRLPASIARVVDWRKLSLSYQKRVPNDEDQTEAGKTRYRARIKSAMRFAREKLHEFGVIGVEQVGDVHVVWPTGKRVVGPQLVWPSGPRVAVNNDGAPDLLDQAEADLAGDDRDGLAPGETPF